MHKTLTQEEFKISKRESLLDFDTYEENFNGALDTFEILNKSFQQPPEVLKKIPAENFMVATRRRAWEGINHLATAYSAGYAISEISEFYPKVLEFWEEYAKYDKAYDATPKGRETYVAHLPLLGEGFDQANRLVCLGILLGWGHLLPRLPALLDYHNPRRDGMLERLLAFYLSERGTPPDECTRHLPYFKTLKIFAAPKEKRSELMAGYLDDWYHASRREPYYDSHTRGTNFMGYWSWEAAAITYLLDIDDRSYRDAQFYPGDLVDFARIQRSYPNGSSAPAQANG